MLAVSVLMYHRGLSHGVPASAGAGRLTGKRNPPRSDSDHYAESRPLMKMTRINEADVCGRAWPGRGSSGRPGCHWQCSTVRVTGFGPGPGVTPAESQSPIAAAAPVITDFSNLKLKL